VVVAVAIAFALACIAASARRLWFATHATAVHPDDLLTDPLPRLRAAARAPEAAWERDLLAALEASPADARTALVNEQLTELDLRLNRWALVPRMCASISTATGIMLGTWVLRTGLLTSEVIDETFVWGVVTDAVSVVGFGVVGTMFCIVAHTRARRLTRARIVAFDKLIEKLETPEPV